MQKLNNWAEYLEEVAVQYRVQVGVSWLPSFDDAGAPDRYSEAMFSNKKLDWSST